MTESAESSAAESSAAKSSPAPARAERPGDASAKVIAEMREITRRYGDGPSAVTAVDRVDLTLHAGEFVAICGESGSGKSTLLQIAGCLDRPTSGSYRLGDREVAKLTDRELAQVRNREIGFVFQSFHLLGDRSALENVCLPLEYRRGGDPPADPETVLERVGLADRARHRPSELSGGERQRVAIARALVKKPPMLLCDEPTGNLDSRTGQEILDLLESLRDEGVTLLMVTHSDRVAERADRVLTMRDGRWA